MNLLQQMLFHKQTIIIDMATWASVRGMTEIKHRCCELSEAIGDEIERLEEAARTTKED